MEEMKKQPYERIIFVCANQKDPGEAACLNRGSGEFQKQLKEYQKSKNIKGLRVSRSLDRKSTRLNSSHLDVSRMPSSA